MTPQIPRSRILIAGAGPAGSGLAIRLADRGFDVTLVERERFPRHKLCGEFISPECLRHFDDLGVTDKMLSAGGERVYETRFYDRRGRSFAVPSGLLDDGGFALSLSRYEMDRCLMDRAKARGVTVLEGTKVSEAFTDGIRLTAIRVVGENWRGAVIGADLFVDATGRTKALSKLVARKFADRRRTPKQGSIAVGFKTHLTGVRLAAGTCEIYAFPGGYGGLTRIEGDLANLCFMMKPTAARKFGGNADELVRGAVCRNERAAWCLKTATPVRDWLAVSVGSFGRSHGTPAKNLFSVGDAAAFIDPFTGSGMLMALESSALLAEAVAAHPNDPAAIRVTYNTAHEETFSKRLRICSMLRRASVLPVLPSLTVALLNFSRRGRNYLAGSTRSSRMPSGQYRPR